METSLKVFLSLTWLSQLGNMAQKSEDLTSRYVHQEKRLISATVGEDVSLSCFHQGGDSAWIFWYKQSLGQMPRLISTFYVLRRQSSFFDEFNNTRFTVKYEDGTCRLSILDLHISDSATYFCASSHTHALTFAQGITVIVPGSGLNLQALVHHAGLQPRGSKNLSCVLHNESCGEGHSVYWFRSSDETHTGLINSKGDMCDQRGTQTHTCVHNLSLNTSGADYCAVLSCGHIQYRNGAKLESKNTWRFIQVCVLSGALAASTILTALLAFVLYVMIKSKISLCSGSPTHSTSNPEGNQDADDLHYVAVNVNPSNRTRRLRESSVECVYSSLKQ